METRKLLPKTKGIRRAVNYPVLGLLCVLKVMLVLSDIPVAMNLDPD